MKKIKFKEFLIKNNSAIKTIFIFILILIIGLYLRFYLIEDIIYFGFDQGRDAHIVRDILNGKFTIIGPRTGVGSLNLGPVYYYLLAPFYLLTGLDPKGAIYFSIIANIFNFIALFFVTKNIFNKYAAFFVITIFSFSEYFILGNRTPWNVSLMVGLAALIFYALYKVYDNEYKWIFVAWILAGFYFNIHFTAIFFPLIIITSLIFAKDKKKAFKYSLISIPLYLIWFMPNLIYIFNNTGGEIFNFKKFIDNYYLGFHLRFMLFRSSYILELTQYILNMPQFTYIKFIIPLIFFTLAFIFPLTKKDRILAYLASLWFIIPLIGFTLYGGPISDYYLLFQTPIVLLMLWYLVTRVYKVSPRLTTILLIVMLFVFIYSNTNKHWVKKPSSSSLNTQKTEVKRYILNNKNPNYDKDPNSNYKIEPYLYTIWTIDEKRW